MCTQQAFIHDSEMLADNRRHSAVLHILYKLHTRSVMFIYRE
jgi:hypothetical protein